VLPHPKVIEGVLGDLSKLLESAPEQARAILKRFMPPVVLAPDGDGWKLSGGLDLEAVLDERGAQQGVGGTGYGSYHRPSAWLEIQAVIT
jgi:hypothetical protein